MSLQDDMKEKRERPNVGICDKEMISSQIVILMKTINEMMHTNNVTTFDLKEIRDLVQSKSCEWEIYEFKNFFEQIWTVWRE